MVQCSTEKSSASEFVMLTGESENTVTAGEVAELV
jgi:hypothetical protein